jgi:hypothetical protein
MPEAMTLRQQRLAVLEANASLRRAPIRVSGPRRYEILIEQEPGIDGRDMRQFAKNEKRGAA